MSSVQTTISPHTLQTCVTRTYPSSDQINAAIAAAADAQISWKTVPLKDRADICSRFLDEIKAMSDDIAKELTLQMGRYGKVVVRLRTLY
jgi:acyl-CoA reductase-like NAD-dependent aldehyde dehydrogenase